MRFPLMLFLFSALLWSGSASARGVFIINSMDCCSYSEAMQGFQSALDAEVTRVCLAEEPDQEALLAVLKASKPDMVAAIGSSAARFAAREISELPVVYFMVMNPDESILRAHNMHGVVLNQNPALMLEALQSMGVDAGHIGTIDSTGSEARFAMKQLDEAVKSRGLELNVATVVGDSDDLQRIDELVKKSDAIILLPDRMAISARSYSHIAKLCRQKRIPLLVPTGLLVKLGGLLSFNHDAADIGRQAAALANRILHGQPVLSERPEYVRHNTMVINQTTVKWNRLRLPRSMLTGSQFYD